LGSGDASQWRQTPWGRILIGLLLAQGLYYGFRHLCTAGLMASGDNGAHDVWNTLYGLIFLQGLQGVGLLVGGMVTGAGKRHGALYGAVVGVWNGVISIFVASQTVNGLTPVALYGQPVLQTAFGALGGFLGSLIWRPLPRVSLGDSRAARIVVPVRRQPSILAGPISLWRIAVGIAVASAGSLWANAVLQFVLESGEGRLSIDSQLQAQLVTWEIVGLALLAGGALGGATMPNGIKQGLFVGLGVAAISIGIPMGGAALAFEQAVYSAFSPITLCLVGGWFGAQLFPPVVKAERKKGLGPASA